MADQINGVLNNYIEKALGENGTIADFLRAAFPGLLAIYAFGSRVNGTSHPGSDLDLSVLVAGYADPLQLWELAGQLSDDLGCPVDLFDLRPASTVMQYQVVTQGKLLWARQPDTGLFECYVLSEKCEFDAARSGLLADIAARGKVYGG